MESTLLLPPRFLSIKGRECCGNVRLFQSSFCGKFIANPQFMTTDAYTNHKSSTKITSFFSIGKKAKIIKKETVVPDPDYRIPIVLLVYNDNLLAAAPAGLLGLLLLFQEVKVGQELEDSGENVFVGGKNRWKYSSFVNWELWWPNFPILVYFKETQTKPEGQVHFFPVIFNGKQLYDVMVERAGPSKTSGPN
ncbi:Protein of unknown function DUF3119 [Cynara cardunculus var. scolymus]|uniref:DUF3119 family protein n=1 Tax=Cynara cardunculus var. scolymus TaxID=59895 RepID=A0A103XMZ3_CYNCS|nr:Protein of unknown function DUF3119 [Cynara cardunculus var. scolymus]